MSFLTDPSAGAWGGVHGLYEKTYWKSDICRSIESMDHLFLFGEVPASLALKKKEQLLKKPQPLELEPCANFGFLPPKDM